MRKLQYNFFVDSVLKSEMVRNTTMLISGTAIAQLIPILLQPLLRRIYVSPEIFGAYSVYLSLIGILLMVSSFKYELAIIQPEDSSEAANVFFLSIIVNFIFNVFLLSIILFYKAEIAYLLNLNSEFSNYLYIVPLGTFLFSFYQSINYWLIREKKFMPISVNKFVRRGFEGGAQVTINIWSKSYGLVLGDLIGHIANVISGIYQAGKTGLSMHFFNFQKITNALKKYSEYPKFNIVPSFMSACSYLLPAILINKYYSTENAGYFDLAKLLLSIPMALVATSLSNVLLQRISEKNKNNMSIKRDLLSILIFVLFAASAEILIIMIWAEDIFKIFFGVKWVTSGIISRVLVWAFAANFIVSSFSSIFISLKEIKLLSLWQLLYFIAILSLFLFDSISFDTFLVIYASIEISCLVIIAIFMIWIVSAYERRISLNRA